MAIVSYNYLEIAGRASRRILRLLLLAQCGMYFLASGNELVTILSAWK
ncbi:MAG: hypothetical protein QM757_15875 [Paludibaculum sp.]